MYDRYRPGYPPDVLRPLREARGLAASHVIADVGSGTGKLAEIFVSNGNTVLGVEPNADMRLRAEALLSGRAGFRSVDGRAEATGLAAGSVDVVAAGQAFHWFDPGLCAEEFRRILRPGGFVVLIWNTRVPAGSPFLEVYEAFLGEYTLDYGSMSHQHLTEGSGVTDFFAGGHAHAAFPNPRSLDFEATWGGYQSASYSLPEGHPRFGEARNQLRALFEAHQVKGVVSMPLRTDVYHGRI